MTCDVVLNAITGAAGLGPTLAALDAGVTLALANKESLIIGGTLVTEEYLMSLERKHFCSLLEHPKTQERIMGMLQTGKPVRN